MPVYIVHGFRWPRDGLSGVRVHVIMYNLEDCSSEYIQNTHSRESLLQSFRQLYPDVMKDLEVQGKSLEFIEQYDPEDESAAAVSQPFAYVADKVVELAGQTFTQQQSPKNNSTPATPLLSTNVEELIADGPGLAPKAWEALADLRDKLAPGEKIGWWVVYNGDPERWYESDEVGDDEDEDEEATTPTAESNPSATTPTSDKDVVLPPKPQAGPPVPPKEPISTSSLLKNKPLPARTKPEEAISPVVKPEAVLPSPKDEKIPEPPKLKEAAKSSGFRKKFFGKRI